MVFVENEKRHKMAREGVGYLEAGDRYRGFTLGERHLLRDRGEAPER